MPVTPLSFNHSELTFDMKFGRTRCRLEKRTLPSAELGDVVTAETALGLLLVYADDWLLSSSFVVRLFL